MSSILGPDFAGIIQRIIDIFQANEAYADQISDFRFGELSQIGDATAYPSVKVSTTENPWQNADLYGLSTPTDPQFTTIFDITVNVNEADPETAKRSLTQLVRETVAILQGNPRLDIDDDPLCIRSTITAIREAGEFRGKSHQAASITLKCQIGSAWILTLPGDIKLYLISKPQENPGVNLDKDLQDDARVIYSALERTGELHVEYNDDDPAIHDAIQALVFEEDEIEVTLTFKNYSRTYTAVLRDNAATARFDELERAVLSMGLVL